MAVIETWLKTDLKKPVQVTQLIGNLFSADRDGNLIGVEITDNGSPATITGGAVGYLVRADGKTVVVNGTVNENRVSILLPASAYVVVGQISIVIKVSQVTVGACLSYVYESTTDDVIDPGHEIPSLDELLAKIADCEAATEAAVIAATAADEATATANTAAGKIDNMTVAAETGQPGSSATAVVSETGGHKHIQFGIPRGDTGADADITSQETTWQNSQSGTAIPTGTWQSTIPETRQGWFLWTRTILHWNNGETTTLYSVSRMGIDGMGNLSYRGYSNETLIFETLQ